MLISETVGGMVQQLSTVHDIPDGSRLGRLRRAVFVQGADLDGTVGDLELSFENGRVFTFGVAGDGESLAIEPNPWTEQFPEPVSTENQEFLWVSGKWEILDLGAALWSYRQYVGRRLTRKDSQGANELLLDFDGFLMRIKVVADELHVAFGRTSGN